MKAHSIKFPSTAHYYTIGKPSTSIKKIFFVLHGYGQLASQIIHKFDALAADIFIVAPEGLSRFYWNETKGIVGASWMTKKDRLTEIEDFCSFLDSLYQKFVPLLDPDVQIHVLGFSQGAATTVRWLENRQIPIHQLILWGAGFPMDLDYQSHQKYWDSLDIQLIFGKQDPYLTPKRLALHQDFIKKQGLNFNTVWYEGKHTIVRKVLAELVANY